MSATTVPPSTTVEIARYARLLRVEPQALSYLRRFDALEIRSLRLATHARIEADLAPRHGRLVSLRRLVPTRVVAAMAQRTLSPRLAAGVVAQLPHSDAVELAERLPPEYLARVCSYLAPTTIEPVVRGLSDAQLSAACTALLASRDLDAMAEMTSALDDERLVRLMHEIEDPAVLLDVSGLITAPGERERMLGLVPDDLLAHIVRYAVTSAAQWSVALEMLALLPPDQRSRLLSVVGASGAMPPGPPAADGDGDADAVRRR